MLLLFNSWDGRECLCGGKSSKLNTHSFLRLVIGADVANAPSPALQTTINNCKQNKNIFLYKVLDKTAKLVFGSSRGHFKRSKKDEMGPL